MIPVVIIDDERRAINVLKAMLEEYCPDTVVVGTAETAEKGIALIGTKQPELVFLDVRMPAYNGFELLDHFEGDVFFKVVFTTAYADHALRAIKYSALDYLLKPISIEELRAAVTKYKASDKRAAIDRSAPAGQVQKFRKITVPSLQGYEFIDPEEVMWINASESYSVFHMVGGGQLTASFHLKRFEDILDSGVFLRIHHSHIVNINHVKRYVRARNAYVIMNDGTELEVSQRKRDVIQALLLFP